MGYFDGLGGDTTAASSWEVADILDLPVVLVVDAKGASLSLAALIKVSRSLKERPGLFGGIKVEIISRQLS